MRGKEDYSKDSAQKTVRDIRRATRRLLPRPHSYFSCSASFSSVVRVASKSGQASVMLWP